MKKLKEIFNDIVKRKYLALLLAFVASIILVIIVAPSCLTENNSWITILCLLTFPLTILGLCLTIYYGEKSFENNKQKNIEGEVHNPGNGKSEKNYRILMCILILALVVSAISLGFRLYENKRHQERIAVEQQHLFRQHTKDFERFMQDSIGIENAYQKIAIGRSTLDQILEMLSLESSLSDTSSNDFINLYNSRVDDAIRTINDAIDDPRNIQRREESKRELGPQKDSIEKLRYIL